MRFSRFRTRLGCFEVVFSGLVCPALVVQDEGRGPVEEAETTSEATFEIAGSKV